MRTVHTTIIGGLNRTDHVGRLATCSEASLERALLRRRCAGHHRERQQGEQDLGHGVRHPVIVAASIQVARLLRALYCRDQG